MTELKTLKDMTCSHCVKSCDKEYCDSLGIKEYHDIDVNDLRQEVKKWIEAMENRTDEECFCLVCGKSHGYKQDNCNSKFGKGYLAEYDYESSDVNGAMMMIKHFFNLEEEE